MDEKKEQPTKEPEKLTDTEFEKKVLELSNKGLTAEKIGELLKKEGINAKDYGKKISLIIKEKGKNYTPSDIINLQNKLEKIKAHYEKNKQDKKSMREKERIFALLRKIKSYHRI